MALIPTCEDLAKENLRLKQTVDELQVDQEKFRAIYDHQLNCLFIHDLEGNFLDANDAALRMLAMRERIFPLLILLRSLKKVICPKRMSFLIRLSRIFMYRG